MSKVAPSADIRHSGLPLGNVRGPIEMPLVKDKASAGRLVWCYPLVGVGRLVEIVQFQTRWFKVKVDTRLYLFHESEIA